MGSGEPVSGIVARHVYNPPLRPPTPVYIPTGDSMAVGPPPTPSLAERLATHPRRDVIFAALRSWVNRQRDQEHHHRPRQVAKRRLRRARGNEARRLRR